MEVFLRAGVTFHLVKARIARTTPHVYRMNRAFKQLYSVYWGLQNLCRIQKVKVFLIWHIK